jgi:hypothetical protein
MFVMLIATGPKVHQHFAFRLIPKSMQSCRRRPGETIFSGACSSMSKARAPAEKKASLSTWARLHAGKSQFYKEYPAFSHGSGLL